MRSRKAQTSGGNVANLILIIALILGLYIMFVPPSERERILTGTPGDGGDNGGSGSGSSWVNSSVLLREHPGRLSYLQDKEFEHAIPSFFLFSSTESVVLRDLNTIYVEHSAFGEAHARNVTLTLDDLPSLENVVLSFEAQRASGILTILLNGEVIYENQITTVTVDPVKLPDGLLGEENLLEFRVSDPGYRFWAPNVYQLSKVRVVGDRTDVSKQQSANVFIISAEEASNIERGTLSFIPRCEDEAAGLLRVSVNGNIVYSNVPDCDLANSIPFSPDALMRGTNSVIFSTDEGSYLIEQIKVQTKLSDDASVVYHFDLNESQWRRFKIGTKHVDLRLQFVDAGRDIEGELIVNGHRTGFFTREDEYTRRIDAYVQEGGNAVRLVPKSTMDVSNLIITFK